MTFWEEVKGLYRDLALGFVLAMSIFALAVATIGVVGAVIYLLAT